MSLYLLDTNVCIEYLRQRNAHVIQRFQAVDPMEIYLCPIVLGELYCGVFKSKNPTRNLGLLQRLLALVQHVPYDNGAAEQYGRIRAHLKLAGTPIGPHDMQIAAIALQRSLVVVTHNAADFGRIPGIITEDRQV